MDAFDFDAAFDADYLHFYEPWVAPRSDAEAALIEGLLGLRPGERVLDLACGTGRIAVRLAERGARVTGLDRSALFLEHARRAAEQRGVAVDWVEGDVRELDDVERFDAVVHWFTSFGYFDDARNRDVLCRIRRSLRPGGRLLLETMNLHQVVFDPTACAVKRVGFDFMIDDVEYDALTGRQRFVRTVLRAGRPPREFRFFVRLLTFTELAGWLRDAGFDEVSGHGEDGAPFTTDAERLIVVARKSAGRRGGPVPTLAPDVE